MEGDNMKLLVLCLIFAPIVFLAFKHKRWYLYLSFAFLGILPEQFAIQLHEKLPLLSGSRVLILILFGFWLYDRWKNKNFTMPKSLLLFLGVNILVSVVNLRYGFGEVNRIFITVFERVLLAVMAMDLITDKEEFHRCLDFAVMGCGALAAIAIMQSVFEFDVASVLHLRQTMASVSISDRMGMIRAFGTFNAISYGCYCAFMMIPIYYRLYKTGSHWYSLIFALNFVALVCTFTRSAWLCIAGIMLLMVLVYRWELIRRLLPSAGIAILICVSLCVAQPKLLDAFVETGKSSLNTVLGVLPDGVTELFVPQNPPGTQPSPEQGGSTKPADPSAPTTPSDGEGGSKLPFELSDQFGLNGEDPTYTRVVQWTAVEYMIQDGQLLFGYGYNAFPAGRLHYFYDRWGAKWEVATTLDVGLVALITEGGLIGAVSFLALLGYMLIVSLRKRGKQGQFNFYNLTIYMIPLFLLLNYLASFMFDDAVWVYIALFYAYNALHSKAEPAAGEQNENG
jgi:hypothetical protein